LSLTRQGKTSKIPNVGRYTRPVKTWKINLNNIHCSLLNDQSRGIETLNDKCSVQCINHKYLCCLVLWGRGPRKWCRGWRTGEEIANNLTTSITLKIWRTWQRWGRDIIASESSLTLAAGPLFGNWNVSDPHPHTHTKSRNGFWPITAAVTIRRRYYSNTTTDGLYYILYTICDVAIWIKTQPCNYYTSLYNIYVCILIILLVYNYCAYHHYHYH